MSVKVINGDFQGLSVGQANTNFAMEPGMEEFANSIMALFVPTNMDSFDIEQHWNEVLARVNQAIELDPTKSSYFAFRAMVESALDQTSGGHREQAINDLTIAINLAQAHETEWVIGKQEWGSQGVVQGLIELITNGKIVNTADSGNGEYNTAFEIKMDIGELYFQRYMSKSSIMGEKDPSAIGDLQMAAQLGSKRAVELLQHLGL
jgi:hypothetical protein